MNPEKWAQLEEKVKHTPEPSYILDRSFAYFEKPEVNKIILTPSQRQARKMEGIRDVWSISGSKAKDIVQTPEKRYGNSVQQFDANFDLEAQTRMKAGADLEDYIVKQIAPMWLTEEYWADKVLVLDKRRYEVKKYPNISVEYDVLVYQKPEKTGLQIIDPNIPFEEGDDENIWLEEQTERYNHLDNLTASWIKVMVMDIKNSQMDVKSNADTYSYQLNLGCWVDWFPMHTIGNFEKNCRFSVFIQPFDDNVVKEIFTKSLEYFVQNVEPAMNEVDNYKSLVETSKNDPTFADTDLVIELQRSLQLFRPNSESTKAKSEWQEENIDYFNQKLIEFAALQKEYVEIAQKVKEYKNELKELEIPESDAKRIKIETPEFKITYSKYVKSGTSSVDQVALNNWFVMHDVVPYNAKVINKNGEEVKFNLEEFIKTTDKINIENPRITFHQKLQEDEVNL